MASVDPPYNLVLCSKINRFLKIQDYLLGMNKYFSGYLPYVLLLLNYSSYTLEGVGTHGKKRVHLAS